MQTQLNMKLSEELKSSFNDLRKDSENSENVLAKVIDFYNSNKVEDERLNFDFYTNIEQSTKESLKLGYMAILSSIDNMNINMKIKEQQLLKNQDDLDNNSDKKDIEIINIKELYEKELVKKEDQHIELLSGKDEQIKDLELQNKELLSELEKLKSINSMVEIIVAENKSLKKQIETKDK